ncbi:MAG: hypothetical protein H7Y59_20065 [Anaerolineales bacterium]|nr:hypothetical protein [Anaerolineales bacterium]
MNYLMEEYLVEERRRNLHTEISQIRLEEQALRGKVFRPNWFTRSMQKFGQLLIVQGEGLVKRYEAPAKKCKSANHSYA